MAHSALRLGLLIKNWPSTKKCPFSVKKEPFSLWTGLLLREASIFITVCLFSLKIPFSLKLHVFYYKMLFFIVKCPFFTCRFHFSKFPQSQISIEHPMTHFLYFFILGFCSLFLITNSSVLEEWGLNCSWGVNISYLDWKMYRISTQWDENVKLWAVFRDRSRLLWTCVQNYVYKWFWCCGQPLSGFGHMTVAALLWSL